MIHIVIIILYQWLIKNEYILKLEYALNAQWTIINRINGFSILGICNGNNNINALFTLNKYSLIMVIAGVFSGIIIDDMIITVVDYFLLVCLFFYFIPLNTLLWSLFKAIVLNDIKSIIALSTISQISYMFIALLINHILCFYHIIIHSLFKSILGLIDGLGTKRIFGIYIGIN